MEELVEKAKKNDENAFNELIYLTQNEMYLIAKSRLKNEDDIADAIQETIIACYKNLRKLRNSSFFKTWLVKILINECNKIYKRKKKHNDYNDQTIINEYQNEIDQIQLDSVSFDYLIRNLKDEEKLILTLYYYSDYSTKEISKILKINESTIRSKIVRAKEKLRKEYGGDLYE